ncbi:MAG: DNA polymerase I [Bryobacteraceae bacterium]
MPRPRLFLIDTYGYVFRAFHARARTGAPPMRTSSGLPTEAVFIFNNMVKKLRASHRPDFMAAVLESDGPTLREQEFAEYKANRAPTPPELTQQIPYVRRLLDAMRIPSVAYPGYEADDVIGTLARKAAGRGYDVVIVSSDKDLLQLVNEQVSMLNPAKDDEWYDSAKVEEFLGVRPEQVADLLALKGDAVDNIPGAPGIGDKGARDLIQRFGSVEGAMEHAAEVERRTYRESLQNNREQIELSKRLALVATDLPVEYDWSEAQTHEPSLEDLRQVYTELEFFSQLKELKPAASTKPWELRQLGSADEFSSWLPLTGPVAVMLGSEGEGLLAETRLGLSVREGEGVSLDPVWAAAMLADPVRPKIAHDSKALQVALARAGIELAGVADDLLLYEFLLAADPGSCSLEVIASKYLDRALAHSIEESAAAAFASAHRLRDLVDNANLTSLYRDIDLPLMPVLARMELVGIRIDPAALATMRAGLEREIERLSAEIYEAAGQTFNINSPQQLGKVLFDDMGLPPPNARGKTKSYSTAHDILETLAEGYPIARLVLDFRQASKLKSTYVDALPALIDPSTGRLHTTFNPAGAATGRLSSSNPNLQNIPIRTELGREIRAAFVPRDGWRLVVADYSQIELRLLAHFSRDPVLLDAFRSGEDIHTRTAAEVFGVMPLMVSPEMRRDAKAVNFGIVYGLSAFGLSGQLGIPRGEAERYIKAYFERYAGVRTFINDTIAQVRETGVTRTMFGRIRPIPDINARNPNARGFAERTAVNTPLQGTAADLIKIAMIAIDRRIRQDKMQAGMLLQVHDELVFEAPPEEVEDLSHIVRAEMEMAASLEVPLVAEVSSGDNWRDAK